MADNATTIVIGFGAALTEDVNTGTGSLWHYRYASGTGSKEDFRPDLPQYSGSMDPIFGPGCRIDANNYGCYAAPTGHAGPEGKQIFDYVTLKPGQDTYVYLDVGFWGGSTKLRKYARTFGLVCGPHVWLCNYGQGGGAPEATDLYSNELSHFQEQMGNFKVVTHATVPLDQPDGAGWSSKIYLILPDMHMWPSPEDLKKRRKEFFTPEELKALDSGLKDGKLVRQPDGSLDIPVKRGESPDEHALRLTTTPEGTAAMKENALSDTGKMSAEEEKHAFGFTAGSDLVELLGAIERARNNDFEVTLLHVGDLLEMWAPYHTWVGPKPFKYEKVLKLTDTANQRIPKWLEMIYNYGHNKAALQALDNAACYQIYGNHDVYIAFDEWNLSNIKTMDRLRHSPGFFSDNLLWVEHGHRFDASNRDGYWMWIDLDHPPGAVVNTAVNYYPELRELGDKYDNSDVDLFKKNVPYATIWYLLTNYANVDSRPRLPGSPPGVELRLPPKFRIFCQGHTHNPVLLKVKVFWSKLNGKYTGTAVDEEIMKEEQRREQGARDGSYTPITTEDEAIQLEKDRERRVDRERGGQ